jgi:CBS domain-containing protein
MQTEVVTLSVYDCLDIAEDVMRLGRVRHLPVLDGDRLVGILSQRDLFRAGISSVLELDREESRAWLEKIPVREVMTEDVVTIHPEETVRTAVRRMLEKKIGCLPVADDGALVGLVSESDCLSYLAHVLETAETKQALPELGRD